jgi:N-acetylglutamate synthase/N-acetylornithine aminotransferase
MPSALTGNKSLPLQFQHLSLNHVLRDTSTNDTLCILANGAASTDGFEIKDLDSAEFREFRDNLTVFSSDLAKLIVRDGEGATKFIAIRVEVTSPLPYPSFVAFVHTDLAIE